MGRAIIVPLKRGLIGLYLPDNKHHIFLTRCFMEKSPIPSNSVDPNATLQHHLLWPLSLGRSSKLAIGE